MIRIKHEATQHGDGFVLYDQRGEALCWFKTLAEALESGAMIARAQEEKTPCA